MRLLNLSFVCNLQRPKNKTGVVSFDEKRQFIKEKWRSVIYFFIKRKKRLYPNIFLFHSELLMKGQLHDQTRKSLFQTY